MKTEETPMAKGPNLETEMSPVKRALLEQRRLKAKVEALERERHEPIAIIGLGCRFPGADNPEAFWNLLLSGTDAIREVPADRWDINSLYDPDPDAPGRVSSRWGGFLNGVDRFDPHLFGISPREAQTMDPQQRLALEVAWEAIENAAQPFDRLPGSATGVFLGIGASDYLQLHTELDDLERIDAYLATGNSHSVAAGRLSYVLGLQGPSLSVDTACSSSLVAVHLACQSLRTGECRMALAGGVNTILWVDNTISLSKAHMLAPDGRCKTFDAAADGFVRAEGCGMVVLKRLSDAIADGDRMVATILGSACNQDGRSSGLTAPNGPSQEAVIRQALGRARIEASQVGYVETHGTGTSLGDPIEVQALGNVLCKDRRPDDPLLLGSAKTNIGHLEAAAGVAGLIKAALCVERGKIPAHLHFKTPNPHIRWEDYALSIPTASREWNSGRGRIAAVSAFGFSGTNAHLIVGQAPQVPAPPSAIERPLHLLVLSAQNQKALEELAAVQGNYLAANRDADLASVCFTLNTGRAHLNERAALTASSVDELCGKLENLSTGNVASTIARGEFTGGGAPELVYLFTGQGSQYVGMGRELWLTQPTFRRALDECAGLLERDLDRPLLDVMFSGDGSLLQQTAYTQPALFSLEYALYQLWQSWGLKPSGVLGHSVGEYVAACVAEVFSLSDALKLIAARGRLMQALAPGGAMAAVLASSEQASDAIAAYGGRISIAALNGPRNTVISGDGEAVEAVVAQLSVAGIAAQRLEVSHAFHSIRMEPMLDEFERIADRISYHPPKLAWASNDTGQMVAGDQVCGASYWRNQIRQPVRFQQGIRTLFDQGYRTFVELGPHPVLIGMASQFVEDPQLSWVSTLRRNREPWPELLSAVSALYVRGSRIDWQAFDQDYSRKRLALPTYPFQRERLWIDQSSPKSHGSAPSAGRWKSAIERASRQAQNVPIDMDLGRFAAKWEALEALTEAQIIQALREFGLFLHEEERHSIEQILSFAGIGRSYGDVISRWLERLTMCRILVREEDEYISRQPLPEPELRLALEEARRALTDDPELWNYVERSCASLNSILRGGLNPLDALFPGGSFETAEFLYQKWTLPRYFNAILQSALESIAQTVARDNRSLRVLELGAGTGGTTASMLPALAEVDAEYWFTDLSDLFLARAERKFSGYPFVRYQIFDLDRDLDEQSMPAHAFDVVIAANVLHATRDLGSTLERVKSLLASEGVLLAFEVTEHLPWFDVTVALIEGWQKHADDLRQRHPLLKPDAWARVLGEHGFEAVEAFPAPGSPAEILGHHVLLARGQGLDHRAMPALRFGTAVEKPAVAPADAQPGREPHGLIERLATLTARERTEALVEFVRGHVAAVLRLSPERAPHRTQRLMDIGVDSLMAVELAGRLSSGLGLKRPLRSTLIFDHPTIQAIAEYVERPEQDGSSVVDNDKAKSETAPGGGSLAQSLTDLSDEEVEQVLLAKLREMK
jgi:acyl transferase domain-containing protein/SAM-dependent methyltransferase/acyl carrier protein